VSLRLSLLTIVSRLAVKPFLTYAKNPESNHHMLQSGARRWFRAPPYALYREARVGRGGLWIAARPGSHPVRPGKLIFYVHGGGFIAGSPETHAALCARLSWLTGVEVFAPRYRVAPADPFPAAVEDVRAAWDGIMEKGYAPGDVVLAGDSAGGNLILGLLADLCASGQVPAGVAAMSPVVDFTFAGASMRDNERVEAMLPARRRNDVIGWYLRGADPRDPHVSPLFAAFDCPPPTLIQVAENEILRDDALRMAEALRKAGGDVTVQTWPNAPHVFQIFDGWVPEARDALEGVAGFVRRCLT
jgi:monoterpene epsilon-lactone hydrolase